MKPNKDEVFESIRKHLKYQDRFSLPRPFIVEFTGTPASGKTTVTEEIYNSFRRNGLQRIYIPQEGAEVILGVERTTPLYNLRTFTYALDILIDATHGSSYDMVIFNRCVFDAYCWMNYWLSKEKLSKAETNLYQEFILSRFWVDLIDLCFFVVCEPEESMRRELRISDDKKLGATTNPETVRLLVERYKNAYELLKPKYKQLHLLDTTHLNEKQMVEVVTDKILEVFWEKTQTKKPSL